MRLNSCGFKWLSTALPLVVLAASGAPAAVAANEQTLAIEARSTPVSAYRDLAVWSSYRIGDNRFHLMAAVGTSVSDLPVRPRAVAFDADVGTDRQGRLVIVYSRCKRDPQSFADTDFSPRRGCDLYEYDFAAKRERSLRATRAKGASEFEPTMSRGVIAFARKKDGATIRPPSIYYQAPGHDAVLVGRGTVTPGAADALPGKLDLHGRWLAYAWRHVVGHCRGHSHPDDGKTDLIASEIWLARLGTRPTRIASACEGLPSGEVSAPSVLTGSVAYLATAGTSIVERNVSDGRRRVTRLPAPADDSSVDISRRYFVRPTEPAPGVPGYAIIRQG